MRRTIFFLLSVLLSFSLLLTGCGSPSYAEHVISHRGAPKGETEHSFVSYDLAIGYGSINIEQDIVSSAEGTLYVSHNQTPERLPGETRRFDEMMDAEIDALQTKDGQHILKQRDVFERYGSSVNYFIEVRNTAQAEALVKLIQKFELERFVTVQAWHVAELQIIEKALPESKRMLLVSKQEQLERAVTNTTV